MRKKMIFSMVATSVLLITACTDSSINQTQPEDTMASNMDIYTEAETETMDENVQEAEAEAEKKEDVTNTVKIDGITYEYSYATIGAGEGNSRAEGKKYISYQEEIILYSLESDVISIDNECVRFVFSDDADISGASLKGYSFEAIVGKNSLIFTAYADYDENISQEEEEEICEDLEDFLRENLVGFGVDTGDGTESVIPSIYLTDIK